MENNGRGVLSEHGQRAVQKGIGLSFQVQFVRKSFSESEHGKAQELFR